MMVHGCVDGVRSFAPAQVHSLSRRCVSACFRSPAQCCSQALSARATGPYDGRMADKCEAGRAEGLAACKTLAKRGAEKTRSKLRDSCVIFAIASVLWL